MTKKISKQKNRKTEKLVLEILTPIMELPWKSQGILFTHSVGTLMLIFSQFVGYFLLMSSSTDLMKST